MGGQKSAFFGEDELLVSDQASTRSDHNLSFATEQGTTDIELRNESTIEVAPENSSSLLKGFLFMNNYCLFNNLAAMSFKVLL